MVPCPFPEAVPVDGKKSRGNAQQVSLFHKILKLWGLCEVWFKIKSSFRSIPIFFKLVRSSRSASCSFKYSRSRKATARMIIGSDTGNMQLQQHVAFAFDGSASHPLRMGLQVFPVSGRYSSPLRILFATISLRRAERRRRFVAPCCRSRNGMAVPRSRSS